MRSSGGRAGAWTAALLATAPAAFVAVAHAEEKPGSASAPLAVELNKLEDRDGAGCRVSMVFANRGPVGYDALRLDLVFFGTDGVIAKRLAVDAAPLRPEKTTVKLFDVAGLPCAGIGQILVNDVLACREAGKEEGGEDRGDCIDRLAVSSRASVPLQK